MSLPFQPALFGDGSPAPDESYRTLRSCRLDDSQHDWEPTVPKAAHGGPRISITYRHSR